MENFNQIFTSLAENGSIGLNLDILETGVINIAALVGILIYTGKDFLGSILQERKSTIVKSLQDAEDRLNEANRRFEFTPFNNEIQTSLINSILFEDFDGDGYKDLLMAGNNYQSEVETTRADAGKGIYLKGNGMGNFKYIPNTKTGFYADKDIRGLLLLKNFNSKRVLIINNNNKHDLFDLK